MVNQNQIEWQYSSSLPSSQVLDAWQAICDNSQLSPASSTPTFAVNAQKLINSEVFYGLGYINGKLVTALPLVIKATTRFGLSFNYLQIAIHDHLDYFVAAGQSELSETQLITSLLASCRKQLPGWHWFFARRWFLINPLKNQASQSYSRQAAYFNLDSKESINDVISKKLLKNLNRFEKKLDAPKGLLNLKVSSNTDEVNDALGAFYQIESAGWKGEAGSAIAQTERLKAFYDECWQQFAQTEKARIFELKQEQKTIAACIGYQHKTMLFLHKITYDETLSKLGPGSILVKKIIEKCIQDKSTNKLCFNTNPPWVHRWHPQIDQLQAIQSFNSNLKGITLKVTVSIYYLLRNIKSRIKNRE